MVATTPAEQRAVVEQWESAEENDLDRLFGTYLARIHWGSRNLPAHAFTASSPFLMLSTQPYETPSATANQADV